MKTEERSIVEFVPFGAKDKIQLTIEVVKRLIAVKTKTGKNCSDDDAMRFLLMCQARKLNPFEGDAFLIGYDNRDQPDKPSFSLITAHQAFLKRAELHPEFDGMDSGTIVMREKEIIDLVGDWHLPTDQILGGWATVFFKNRSRPMHKRLRLARFKKNYGIWNDDPAGMIVKCAEADALRSSFPTMLGGMFIREEMPSIEAEIARPVFQESDNGPVEPATTETPVRAELEEPPKKKEPTLKRKSQTVRSVPTEKAPPNRSRMIELLADSKYKPEDFVSVAIDEGWIEVGTAFDNISEDQFAEFMRAENWRFVVEMLDERTAKQQNAAAERGNLL
jgi:phage recombination protein Bet